MLVSLKSRRTTPPDRMPPGDLLLCWYSVRVQRPFCYLEQPNVKCFFKLVNRNVHIPYGLQQPSSVVSCSGLQSLFTRTTVSTPKARKRCSPRARQEYLEVKNNKITLLNTSIYIFLKIVEDISNVAHLTYRLIRLGDLAHASRIGCRTPPGEWRQGSVCWWWNKLTRNPLLFLRVSWDHHYVCSESVINMVIILVCCYAQGVIHYMKTIGIHIQMVVSVLYKHKNTCSVIFVACFPQE
jgi:hypothetical protein